MVHTLEAREKDFLEQARNELNLSGGCSENIMAAIKQIFVSFMAMDKRTSFIGLYILDKYILVLGPYVGQPTVHDLIPISRGVVGKCAADGKHNIVGDVSRCDIYLECCEDVKSEIVIPIKTENQAVKGVLDLDSPTINAYKESDLRLLSALAAQLLPAATKLSERVQLRTLW